MSFLFFFFLSSFCFSSVARNLLSFSHSFLSISLLIPNGCHHLFIIFSLYLLSRSSIVPHYSVPLSIWFITRRISSMFLSLSSSLSLNGYLSFSIFCPLFTSVSSVPCLLLFSFQLVSLLRISLFIRCSLIHCIWSILPLEVRIESLERSLSLQHSKVGEDSGHSSFLLSPSSFLVSHISPSCPILYKGQWWNSLLILSFQLLPSTSFWLIHSSIPTASHLRYPLPPSNLSSPYLNSVPSSFVHDCLDK